LHLDAVHDIVIRYRNTIITYPPPRVNPGEDAGEELDERVFPEPRMTPLRHLMSTRAPAAVVVIRVMVGVVFASEGVQKFLFPEALGAGRFARIGIPAPNVMGPFVGVVEIIFGSLILLGLLTRLAAVPILVNISVAIVSTKIPILLGHGFWRFALPKAPSYGLWSMLHEARTDLSMFLGLLFLLIVGGGACSIDAFLMRRFARRVTP
jgi:uncharacterized membrane protein YphA (DoxX/SURF4 family)